MNATIEKKPTHIQSRRDAAERCMRRVMWLLHWSDEQYCWFKYEAGLEYLRIYLRGDDHAVAQLERSPVFWGWWKNHWTIREEDWLQGLEKLQNLPVRTRWNDYRSMHNPEALAAEMHPHAVHLGDSYATMIQTVFTNAKKI